MRCRSAAVLGAIAWALQFAASTRSEAQDGAPALLAAELGERVRDKVLNESIAATWVGPTTLVYRVQSAPDAWRWMMLDAATGTIAEAFDHGAAAGALTAFTGTDLGPDRLRLARFTASDSGLLAMAILPNTAVAVRLTGDAAGPIDLAQLPEAALLPVRADRSQDAGSETLVVFISQRSTPVTIAWLDADGTPHDYGTLGPGEQRRQHTFAGHAWRVMLADGTALSFLAEPEPAAIVLPPEPTPPDPQPPAADQPADQPADEPGSQPPTEQAQPPGLRSAAREAARLGTRIAVNDAALSPDGQWRASIDAHNVIITHTSTGEVQRLSEAGTKDNAYTHAFLWSPDSRRLATLRVEPAQQRTVIMVESSPTDRLQPRVHRVDYLKPGDRIAHPRPAIFDLDRGHEIPLDDALYPDPWSLDHLAWSGDSVTLSFLYNQRGHQVLRVVAIDARTGAAHAVLDESSRTFLDYSNKLLLHRLESTREIVWMSERSGFNHLYLIDADSGSVKNAITSGDWLVRDVLAIDEGRRTVLFRAMGVYPNHDPYHVHFGRVSLDGSHLTWLTAADGTHELAFSPYDTDNDGLGDHYIATHSRADLAPVHELRRTGDGGLVATLAAADWRPLLDTGWRPPERFVAKARDGQTDIWGLLFTPTGFDPANAPAASLPIIEEIYAGPHGHHVPKAFQTLYGHEHLAELGFAVVRIDGMGTNWRSKAFHDVCWQNLADAGFPDRIAWIRAIAATRPYMDLNRVGIYGGSAGGQSAVRALIAHHDFYKAAAADCGCHDNRMDKIWWNEAWMGYPIGPHYADQSNTTNAHLLNGQLLLTVGELDRNVDPASTMQLVNALVKADKDFELIVFPGMGHGAGSSPYGQRRLREFFVRSLGPLR